ncbi:MAG TPA: TIM barrel protein [Anaerolinea sp.]|nr:TIM barrel protein [Anaerolinea sp.]
MPEPSLEAALLRIREDGYDGVETGAPVDADDRRALRDRLDKLGLDMIVQVWTVGKTPAEHARSLEEQYRRAVELRPRLVNVQSGRDTYSVEENAAIYRRGSALEAELGVPLAQEIHRGRASFCIPAALALLQAVPMTRLTADFSHWCCVHESLLQDQVEALDKVINHCVHIHARVGHAEGPQVSDPRAPEWRPALRAHLGWWQRIADQRKAAGAEVLTITPEFGPPDYMQTLPFTRQPVNDLRSVNLAMREILAKELII